MSKRIVIYGGEMAGICAALKAANTFPGKNSVTIIYPYVSTKPGGLATVGGLNCWDSKSPLSDPTRKWINENPDLNAHNHYCQHGTFKDLLPESGEEFYEIDNNKTIDLTTIDDNTDITHHEMGNRLQILLHRAGVEVIPMMDIYDIETSGNMPISIKKLYLKSIFRDSYGYIKWGRKTRVIEGDFFVDASEDGKLISSISPMTTGRFDWPFSCIDENGHTKKILENCETNEYSVARQQAAGLYFKIKGLKTQKYNNDEYIKLYNYASGYDEFRNYGVDTYNEDANSVYKFNVEHFNDNCMIKTYNFDRNLIVKNGFEYINCKKIDEYVNSEERENAIEKSKEFWANTFLLFKVDGRAHYRDLITKFYPKAMISDTEDTDSAWIRGKKIIGSDEFKLGINGYSNSTTTDNGEIEILRDEYGEPIVADALYIRETVHMPIAMYSSNNSEDNYAINKDETIMRVNDAIKDNNNYISRIGLGFYHQDIHPYLVSDKIVKESSTKYVAEDDLSRHRMRPDVFKKITQNNKPPKSEFINESEPKEAYIPFETIYTERAANLLIPGNAASVGSFSWGEMRVLPNQCVWGDAAGTAFAICAEEDCTLTDLYYDLLTLYENKDNLSIFSTENNKFLKFQEELRKNGACLDKPTAATPYFTSYPTNQEETNE